MKTGPKPLDPIIRFWRHVEVDRDTGCWLWIGSLDKGYGRFGENWKKPPVGAHLFAWRTYVGPVPDGLELDHLCRVRNCVNPAHLEPVTTRENLLRGEGFSAKNAQKTHCPQGHEYTPENTYRWRGQRKCRECEKSPEKLAYQAAYREAHREKQREYMKKHQARRRAGDGAISQPSVP